MNCLKLFFSQFFIFLSFSVFSQVDGDKNFEKDSETIECIEKLDLSGQVEPEIPEAISELECLEELNLSGTNLIKLPNRLSRCKNLKKINLSYNPDMDVNQVCDLLRSLQIKSLSLEGCQLAFIPFQIAEIRSLNNLNVSNNLIGDLPDNFGKLVNLVHLDLAMNYIDSVNFKLNTLPKLKTIDLSFNTKIVIDHLIESELDFPALEEIKLVGVNNFPSTLNLRKGRLKKLDLSNTSFKNLNQNTTDSFKVDHIIARNCKKLDYDFACKTLQNSGVKNLEIADEKMENLPTGIRRMKDLEELSIENAQINYVPSLNNHKKLKRITVESNKLNTLFSSVSRLKNLEYLNIKATEINNSEVEKLVEHFPHAEIVYNPQKQGVPFIFPEYLKDISYKVPFRSLEKTFERFKFSGKEKTEITLNSGTIIKINSNSLITSDGKVYTGEVNLNVKEYKSSLDIYLSGLPMIYDSNAVYGFESGGMYNIEATTTEGRRLELADNNPLVINTAIPENTTGFQSYTLEDGAWVNNGTSSTYSFFNEIEPFRTNRRFFVNPDEKPELKHQDFGIEIWKSKDVKCFQLSFISNGYNKIMKDDFNYDEIMVSEFSVFANDKWIIVDPYAEEKIKSLKNNKTFKSKDFFTPFSKNNPKVLFQEIQEVKLEPQYEKDNFLLTVVTSSSTIQLEIIQDFSRTGPKSSKRKLKTTWKRYESMLKKYEKRKNDLRNEYEYSMKTYQEYIARQYKDSVLKANDPEGYAQQQKARREGYAQQQKARRDYQNLKNGIFNSVVKRGEFKITQMGISNIDRIMQDLIVYGAEYQFESFDENGDTIELDHISILSSAYQSAMKFVGNKFMIHKKSKALVLAKTKNGDLAYISKSNFMKMLSNQNEIKELHFTVINPSEASKDELAKIISK
tara:strand:+ start:7281 stop:10001 length:2721 start_codon:yes stop_codon:yes gene_type:complete